MSILITTAGKTPQRMYINKLYIYYHPQCHPWDARHPCQVSSCSLFFFSCCPVVWCSAILIRHDGNCTTIPSTTEALIMSRTLLVLPVSNHFPGDAARYSIYALDLIKTRRYWWTVERGAKNQITRNELAEGDLLIYYRSMTEVDCSRRWEGGHCNYWHIQFPTRKVMRWSLEVEPWWRWSRSSAKGRLCYLLYVFLLVKADGG